MTTAEAAAAAHCSIKTIQKHIRNGLLPATPGARRGRGHDWTISEAALATYLATPPPRSRQP